jgi:hypothetical protein
MHKAHLLVSIIVLTLFSSVLQAANQLTQYSIKEAMDLEETKLSLGDSVKFYFGEKPSHVSGNTIAISKVLRKTMRKNDYSCHRAFLSSLLKLKEEAMARNSSIVVNVGSNLKDNYVLNKDTYLCLVGAVVVQVALKGEILEPSASASGTYNANQQNGYSDSQIISSPVIDTSDAILMPEPVITPHGTYSQTPSVSMPAQQSPSQAQEESVSQRLSALKKLYDAGQIDQATYEAQKQRILNSL